MFKSILCLNGLLPNQNIIRKFTQETIPLIAADGAANTLKHLNIIPTTIIGDLDSIDQNLEFGNAEIIQVQDQNSTDFEKCLTYIRQYKLFPTLVLGINGGEIDHIIDNIHKFIKYSTHIPMIFFDMPNKWGITVDKNLSMNFTRSNTVSVFPFIPNTHLKSEGLHWELDSSDHHIFKKVSTRNKANKQKVRITSSDKKVLVITESDIMPFEI